MANPRVSGFAYVPSLCRPFKQQKSSSFFYCTKPHWFLQLEEMGVYLHSDGILGCTVWPGVEIACFQVIHPNFYTPCANVWPSILLPLQLLPPWATTLLCSSPQLCPSHACGCGFFTSLVVRLPYSVISWRFWVLLVWDLVVIISLAAWGSIVCLPMLPSWPEICPGLTWRSTSGHTQPVVLGWPPPMLAMICTFLSAPTISHLLPSPYSHKHRNG